MAVIYQKFKLAKGRLFHAQCYRQTDRQTDRQTTSHDANSRSFSVSVRSDKNSINRIKITLADLIADKHFLSEIVVVV